MQVNCGWAEPQSAACRNELALQHYTALPAVLISDQLAVKTTGAGALCCSSQMRKTRILCILN